MLLVDWRASGGCWVMLGRRVTEGTKVEGVGAALVSISMGSMVVAIGELLAGGGEREEGEEGEEGERSTNEEK